MNSIELNALGESQSKNFVLVGLGNPGREYRNTKHNIGFMVIDQLCRDLAINISRMQSKALIGTGIYEGHKIILAKPQTFMNLSGQSVSALVRFYKIPFQQLLVIHDDLDLPLGTLRLRASGGSAGQKGIASTITELGTEDFSRLRVGIGRPPGRMDAADYVLQDFRQNEQGVLTQVIERASEAARLFIKAGLSQAMNTYNGPISKEE